MLFTDPEIGIKKTVDPTAGALGGNRLPKPPPGRYAGSRVFSWLLRLDAERAFTVSLLDKLQRRLGRFAIPHLTLAILSLQVPVYVISLFQPQVLEPIRLVPSLVLQGEFWRLFTFVAVPPEVNIILAYLHFNMFYFMGTILEAQWGTFRYNVFMLVGYVATVAASFLAPELPASNAFLLLSVLLAFAYRYPEFVVNLYFLFPMRVKWIAMLAWGVFAWMMYVGDWNLRLSIGASVLNFFLFFGREILHRMRWSARQMELRRRELVQQNQPRHQCRICGKTEQSHPRMIFRYCSKCAGNPCYCEEHIYDHEHIEEVSV